jgi:DNA modification methylase
LSNKTNEELALFFAGRYACTHKPIPVDFRRLFPNMNVIDRYTHMIHAYPAKLITHIPNFFLNNSFFSKEGDTVLDPFCGTGTVLLEANLAKRNAFGADINPLARKIAMAKTQKLSKGHLNKIFEKIIKRYNQFRISQKPNIKNIDFWFPKQTQIQLSKISRAISELPIGKYKNFFEVCFSNCVKKVSYADPRIAVPVKLNLKKFEINSFHYNRTKKRIEYVNNIDVFEKFKAICQENIERIGTLAYIQKDVYSKIIAEDAKSLTKTIHQKIKLEDNCVDMIITSPPYAGAQKYIRSSSLNLGWLDLKNEEIKRLEKMSVGRELYNLSELRIIKTNIRSADILLNKLYKENILRANIVGNYLLEMKSAINESIRVLKNGGYLIMVIGNNKVCSYEFNTQKYLTEYIQSIGLNLQFKLIDDIKSYGLMTKRNKTADIISREWILVFRK